MDVADPSTLDAVHTPHDLFLTLVSNKLQRHRDHRWASTPTDELPYCGACHIDIDATTTECECWDYNTDAPRNHWPNRT